MRRDLPELVALAKKRGLKVEVQTNAVLLFEPLFQRLARNLDRIGLSLDADTPAAHDAFRSRLGNFDEVIRGLQLADSAQIPVVVRSTVSSVNVSHLAGLAAILAGYRSVEKWSLRQFTPLGRGANVIGRQMQSVDFLNVALDLQRQCIDARRHFTVAVVSRAEMSRCYCLITPDGQVYTHPETGNYSSVGKFPEDSLAKLLSRLDYDASKRKRRDHAARCGLAVVRR